MQTIAAILITAAATAGTVRAAKKLRRVLQRRTTPSRPVARNDVSGPIIDLERDSITGVYSRPRQ